ncbi:TlpA disulfide reductase family protein [Massilia sp. DJPM01]|uniref:peroxiredoxin family protein n=1 Tax=Massilia sp. DJPM01 TaxID=3024404 RepID=UPI00259FAEFD|nr:TlpA disulfide reductase family protein [Massilia sp. DJPM01]MDM5179081.1 TlpA disulfide reductase family protein [Massilia sp. DJPM01]
MSTQTPSPSSWLKPALIGAAVLAIAAAGYVALTRGMAPDVTFLDIKGQKISSQSLRGKVFMVNFWATSCATCVKEMPQMVDTYNKFKGEGMEFIAVAMKYDAPSYVLNFTETRQLPFTVALDSSGDLAKAFGDVTLTPTTFVINKEGKIIKRYVGEPDFPALHKLLQETIAGKA